jgi:AcrR family transcriptional regulator
MMADNATQPPRDRIVAAARRLFNEKGFHSTSVAELAAAAGVSVGQIYRFFPGKDDMIVAIVATTVASAADELQQLFNAAAEGRLSVYEAIRAIAQSAIEREEGGLDFEILAEAYRNPRVSETLAQLIGPYRTGVKRLAALVRPDVSAAQLDAYAEIMMACFFGLGHRTLIAPSLDIACASRETASLILRALGHDDARGSLKAPAHGS